MIPSYLCVLTLHLRRITGTLKEIQEIMSKAAKKRDSETLKDLGLDDDEEDEVDNEGGSSSSGKKEEKSSKKAKTTSASVRKSKSTCL